MKNVFLFCRFLIHLLSKLGYRIDAAKWDLDKQRVKNGCSNKLKELASEINEKMNDYLKELAKRLSCNIVEMRGLEPPGLLNAIQTRSQLRHTPAKDFIIIAFCPGIVKRKFKIIAGILAVRTGGMHAVF